METKPTKPKMMIEFKQAAKSGALDLYIYDNIVGDGYDWWTGETVESETSQKYFRDQLAEYPDVKQINLYVNSEGGSVYEAMGIRAQLMRHPANVTAFVDGFAASAASLILTGCNEVVMDAASTQLLHNMWTFAIGNADELRKVADELDQLMVANRQAYLDKVGDKLDEASLIQLMSEERWLTAAECMDMGLCDRVETIRKEEPVKAPEAKKQLIAFKVLTEIVASARQTMEQPEEDPPDVDAPPDEAEPEPAEPAEETNDVAEHSGVNFLAALATAAERSVR